jgi:glucose/arabinose dehydrogenase
MRTAGTLLISIMAVTACGDGTGSGNSNGNEGSAGGSGSQGSIDAGNPDSPGDATPGSDAAVDAPDEHPVNVHCAPENGGIRLPAGFCATVFADHLGKARHITVTPSGRVFVAIQPLPDGTGGHVVGLFDANNDGVAEQQESIGDLGGNGIAWSNGQLYVASTDRIVRYAVRDDMLRPEDTTPVVVVADLPVSGDHTAKTVVISGTRMFVNIGSASNACQVENRVLHSPGEDPCDELPTRAGVWEFDATATGQTLAGGKRIGTGMRNTNALALDPATHQLWGGINGRDQLHENWPELFTEDQDRVLPSDEVVAVTPGVDRGWPYCYHDALARQMKLAPEYGGDGKIRGRCAAIGNPQVALPAHAAVLGMVFATGTQLPVRYRGGAFVANHGSRFDANATGDLHGYDVMFLPFAHGRATGTREEFATGFDAGMRPLPDAAPHRPVGLAMMPDGSLLIGDDKGGRIWRVFFTGRR